MARIILLVGRVRSAETLTGWPPNNARRGELGTELLVDFFEGQIPNVFAVRDWIIWPIMIVRRNAVWPNIESQSDREATPLKAEIESAGTAEHAQQQYRELLVM